MKKILVIVLAVVICLSMAACEGWEDIFPTAPGNEATTEATTEPTENTESNTEETTESVPDSEDEFVPSITYKGSPELVNAKDADGNELMGSLEVVSVSETEELPDEKRKLMEKIYEELDNGTMDLPYEKVEGVDGDKMVIRELLVVDDMGTEDHESGYILTFNLGVGVDDVLVVMSYVEGEQGFEWVPAAVTNNGDGTVTIWLEELGPVAIAIEG